MIVDDSGSKNKARVEVIVVIERFGKKYQVVVEVDEFGDKVRVKTYVSRI